MFKSSRLGAKNTIWSCLCDCGNTTQVPSSRLRNGHTSSCGCWRDESRAARAVLRRKPFKRERQIYYWMIQRCHNPNNRAYKWYGARGIGVCSRWLKSFDNFMSDMGPSNGLWLERSNNLAGYSISNCVWATPTEQANNRRSNVFLEVNGERKTIAEWSRHTGLKAFTIYRRRRLGWPEESLLLPLQR